jgi:hypothetical protein
LGDITNNTPRKDIQPTKGLGFTPSRKLDFHPPSTPSQQHLPFTPLQTRTPLQVAQHTPMVVASAVKGKAIHDSHEDIERMFAGEDFEFEYRPPPGLTVPTKAIAGE